MVEISKGYFPDVPVTWSPSPQNQSQHSTEVLTALNGVEQRFGYYPAGGKSHFTGAIIPNRNATKSALAPSTQEIRRQVYAFLNAHRGRLVAFNFWNPFSEQVVDETIATITAQSKVIAPFKAISLTDIRVGGVTKAFSIRPLITRPGSYAPNLRLNGSTQYVSCGSSSTLRATGDQTLTGWIWWGSNASQAIVVGNQTPAASGISIQVTTVGALQFYSNTVGAQTIATSTGRLVLNTWMHFAIVRSGTTVTFYLNGVAAGSGGGVTNPVAATIAFAIGAVAGAVDGMVAEFRYYDVAVSAGEVANIYAGNGTPSANLRGWWRLDEGYGTSVTDWSGYANTGTLTNSPVWVCGEDEYSFTAGAQTGVVTFWGEVRRLIVARNDMDGVAIEFVRSAEVLANVPLSIQGLV